MKNVCQSNSYKLQVINERTKNIKTASNIDVAVLSVNKTGDKIKIGDSIHILPIADSDPKWGDKIIYYASPIWESNYDYKNKKIYWTLEGDQVHSRTITASSIFWNWVFDQFINKEFRIRNIDSSGDPESYSTLKLPVRAGYSGSSPFRIEDNGRIAIMGVTMGGGGTLDVMFGGTASRGYFAKPTAIRKFIEEEK